MTTGVAPGTGVGVGAGGAGVGVGAGAPALAEVEVVLPPQDASNNVKARIRRVERAFRQARKGGLLKLLVWGEVARAMY